MEEEYENRIKELLTGIDREFLGFNYYHRARFALDQISMWQKKFDEAKHKIPREINIDAMTQQGKISLIPEIEAA